MTAELSLGSYVTQWFGYVSWCAATSDATCRPFVGFLALLGACAGLSSLFLLGMVRMLQGWERDIVAARAARQRGVRSASAPAAGPVPAAEAGLPARPEPLLAPAGLREPASPLPEPALGLGVPAPAYMAHGEPALLKLSER